MYSPQKILNLKGFATLRVAQEVLDFFLQIMGEEIYKKAIKDCKKLLKERLEDLEVELEILSPSK
jgi:uncharacterized protein (DUF2164 family)